MGNPEPIDGGTSTPTIGPQVIPNPKKPALYDLSTSVSGEYVRAIRAVAPVTDHLDTAWQSTSVARSTFDGDMRRCSQQVQAEYDRILGVVRKAADDEPPLIEQWFHFKIPTGG